MSAYTVEYDPMITFKARKIISSSVVPEMSSSSTAIYEIQSCIEALKESKECKTDYIILNDMSDCDVNPIQYIEF